MNKQAIWQLLKQASFLSSAPTISQCPSDEGIEIAFAGRSNAGKSSAINTLCNQKKLARTSKTPGRTQLINFFKLSDNLRLVDLPGYGYAHVPEAMKKKWRQSLAGYFEHRQSLKGIVLIMDIRHPLKAFDQQMLLWSQHFEINCHILLTKADKLSRNQQHKQLSFVEKEINHHSGLSVSVFSALKKQGLTNAERFIEKCYLDENL